MSWGERAAEQYEKDQPAELFWRWDQNPTIYIRPDEGTQDHEDDDDED